MLMSICNGPGLHPTSLIKWLSKNATRLIQIPRMQELSWCSSQILVLRLSRKCAWDPHCPTCQQLVHGGTSNYQKETPPRPPTKQHTETVYKQLLNPSLWKNVMYPDSRKLLKINDDAWTSHLTGTSRACKYHSISLESAAVC